MNYKDICLEVCEIARQAGQFIREQRVCFSAQDIEIKGSQNFVSYVDKQAERMIVDRVMTIIPHSALLTEEGTEKINHSDSDFRWIIDPLDGTTNFIHGMPPYCVSIALEYRQEIVVGVIYEITRDECYYTFVGASSYMNGLPISVSKVNKIEDSLVITGLAYNVDHIRVRFNELFDYFNRNTHGARRSGSAAANLAYVAAGRSECFYQTNLSAWDVAAGSLIVINAGGCVTDFSLGRNYVYGKQIIATNGITHKDFLEIIK